MMKRFLSHLLICFSVLLPASAQAVSGPWQGNDVMDARLVAAVNAAGDTAMIEAGLEFRLAPGWKVYWRSPGDAGLPPRNSGLEKPKPDAASINTSPSDNASGLPLRPRPRLIRPASIAIL